MARARNIKPSFFENDLLGELPALDRLFFIGLWTVADYRGCVEFRPKKLQVQILPYDQCDVNNIAINLEQSGFIRLYSVQGKTYLKVVNFEKHQNPHKNERDKGSDLPDVNEVEAEAPGTKGLQDNPDKNGTTPDKNGTDPADSCSLNPDSGTPLPDPGEEKGGSRSGSSLLTFSGWIRRLDDAGEQPITPDDTIFKYADDAGIPHEWLRATWVEFKTEFSSKDKRQKDWRAHFRNFVRKNYYALWWIDGGEYKLTSRGQQAMMALKGQEQRAA